ncbi:MAG: UDP-N-acetylmuramoyl-L-alanine--D-glutamate ligase [Chloroflexota bacterium]
MVRDTRSLARSPENLRALRVSAVDSDPLAGKRLVILGLARQGKALARFAVGVGARVTVSDLRPAALLQSSLDELQDLGIETVLGEHPMSLLDTADVLAISGGVPADLPLVVEARRRGLPITNDALEFARRCPCLMIGVTGSAGKTTTTALTGRMAELSGRRTWVGGNIGRPLISDLAAMRPDDLVVMELSSFQLELWDTSPQVAAVLNVTPNHLDRHQTMEAYTRAKANILRFQTAGDVAVLSADDPGAFGLRDGVRGRLRLFSLRRPVADGAFVQDGAIWLRESQKEQAVCPLEAIQLRGRHNVLNVLAATGLAEAADVPLEAIRAAVTTFTGVEHRLERVGLVNGVHYVNDSIATAPERALAALDSFSEPIILLAGGRDKKLEWAEWARCVRQQVKAVVLFGELAGLLEEWLTRPELADLPRPPIVRVDGMAEAVQEAAAIARPGDVVLLSPGGTSFDAYLDFADRGEQFRQIVRGL